MATRTASLTAKPAWHAFVAKRTVYPRRLVKTKDGKEKQISWPLDLFYVVFQRQDFEDILFSVSWPGNRLVFSDRRECQTGTAGSTGRWGTLPASRSGKRRSLTPSAWKREVCRFIGEEEADRFVRFLSQGKPLF